MICQIYTKIFILLLTYYDQTIYLSIIGKDIGNKYIFLIKTFKCYMSLLYIYIL